MRLELNQSNMTRKNRNTDIIMIITASLTVMLHALHSYVWTQDILSGSYLGYQLIWPVGVSRWNFSQLSYYFLKERETSKRLSKTFNVVDYNNWKNNEIVRSCEVSLHQIQIFNARFHFIFVVVLKEFASLNAKSEKKRSLANNYITLPLVGKNTSTSLLKIACSISWTRRVFLLE